MFPGREGGLKIAITADPYLPVPPQHYGGIERVVDFLVRGLVARGHEVTLFAHEKSKTGGSLVSYGCPPHFGFGPRMRELWQVGSRLWSARHAVDVVHSFGRLAALLPILPLKSLPKIQSYQRAIPVSGIRRAHRIAGDSLFFTACSTQMYRGAQIPGNWSTIFNGVELDKYAFRSDPGRDAPLVFLGRLERIKGPHHAVAIARASGRDLVLAGNVVRTGPDSSYFDEELAPAIDGRRIRYVGEVDDAQKAALLGRAAALLMPIEWDEPFGIVMVEAMACGTPVIGFARGSLPEVIRDGVNGFLCSNCEEAVALVPRLHEIDRLSVREEVSRRFASGVIVQAYERLYEDAIRGTASRRLSADVGVAQ
jgi:glycosyltransferase involved in cell wall biosynthesis